MYCNLGDQILLTNEDVTQFAYCNKCPEEMHTFVAKIRAAFLAMRAPRPLFLREIRLI